MEKAFVHLNTEQDNQHVVHAKANDHDGAHAKDIQKLLHNTFLDVALTARNSTVLQVITPLL